jgi:putative membrane protein insertion efficiency factor
LKPNSVTSSSRAFAVNVALAAVEAYQRLFSPYFAGSCRFLPSCSEYARQAIEAHGVMRGCLLALRRLGRCHPLCPGGHDPIPPAARALETRD